jgi:hypothetical protein
LQLTAAGTYDASFGNLGIFIRAEPYSNAGFDEPSGICLLDDGSVVVPVAKVAAEISGICLGKIAANGGADPNFGADGVGPMVESGGDASGILRDSAGRFVVTMRHGNYTQVARFNPNGAVDRTFGVNGVATIEMPGAADARGIAVQKDGRIVVVTDNGLLRLWF